MDCSMSSPPVPPVADRRGKCRNCCQKAYTSWRFRDSRRRLSRSWATKGQKMSTSDQSRYAPVSIDLRCDFPGAEVLLIDGEQRLIARQLQQLVTTVAPGIYIVRVMIGDSIRDETVVIRPDKPFARTFVAPPVASAIPLQGSARSHEYHQAAIGN